MLLVGKGFFSFVVGESLLFLLKIELCTVGTEALFGKFDNVIERAKRANKIVKADAGILGFFNDAWKNVAGCAYNKSKEKKKKS